jgi:hypothetical protein
MVSAKERNSSEMSRAYTVETSEGKGSTALANLLPLRHELQGVAIMQVDPGLAAALAAAAIELKYKKPDPGTQTDDQPNVGANDNGSQWPFPAFPRDWYASP